MTKTEYKYTVKTITHTVEQHTSGTGRNYAESVAESRTEEYSESIVNNHVDTISDLKKSIIGNTVQLGSLVEVDRNVSTPLNYPIPAADSARKNAFLFQQKRDNEHATLEILDTQGRSIAGTLFDNFIIDSVEETSSEKYQVIDTFDDFYVFFYGASPQVFSFTGKLIDFANASWLQDFTNFYNQNRGTKLAENKYTCFVSYSGRTCKGFILNFRRQQNVALDALSFAFDFLVVATTAPVTPVTTEEAKEEEVTQEAVPEGYSDEGQNEYEESMEDAIREQSHKEWLEETGQLDEYMPVRTMSDFKSEEHIDTQDISNANMMSDEQQMQIALNQMESAEGNTEEFCAHKLQDEAYDEIYDDEESDRDYYFTRTIRGMSDRSVSQTKRNLHMQQSLKPENIDAAYRLLQERG